MKAIVAISAAASFIHASASRVSVFQAQARFGPGSCVSLRRSPEGSCVIATSCAGKDTSKLEFAFDCQEPGPHGGLVRHSFGIGGFDDVEEFDTDIKCSKCSAPTDVNANIAAEEGQEATPAATTVAPALRRMRGEATGRSLAVSDATSKKVEKTRNEHHDGEHDAEGDGSEKHHAKDSKARAEQSSGVVSYGPKSCVSTYKEKGNCIIETKCEGVNIAAYEFGMICVDNDGKQVRHLFGRDSFDNEETFDTLIVCDKCLGLEDVPIEGGLAAQIGDLAKEVGSLETLMVNLTEDVGELNKAVFKKPEAGNATKKAAGAKGTPATNGTSSNASNASALIHSHRVHRPHSQTSHQKSRHAHREQQVEQVDSSNDDDQQNSPAQFEDPPESADTADRPGFYAMEDDEAAEGDENSESEGDADDGFLARDDDAE